MSDAHLQASAASPTNGGDADVPISTESPGTDTSAGITLEINHELPTEVQDDANPRSPKRRRLSPADEDIDVDVDVDFEAAAARALAISLGVEPANVSPVSIGPNQPSTSQPAPNSAPSQQDLRMGDLSSLDNVASEILSTLAKMSHLEIGQMLFGPASQKGQEYRAIKARFEDTKHIYLTNSPFVSLPAVGFKEAEQVEILRKTNMATFMASIFSGEIGLRIMDMNFLDVFVPEGGRLLKAQASIYLELKTQAFIAAKRTAPAMLNQVMLDLFPNDMDKYLVAKRPGAKSLAPSEIDFLKRLASRRDILYADMRNNRLENLELRYRWDDFSREVNSYLSKNFDQSGTNGKDKGDQPSPTPARAQLQQDQMQSQFSLAATQTQMSPVSLPVAVGAPDLDFDIDDFMVQAARAAEIALHGGGQMDYAPARPMVQPVAQSPSIPSVQLQQTSTISSTMRPETPAQSIPAPTPPPPPPPASHQEVQDGPTVSVAEFQQYKPATAEKAATTDDIASAAGGGDVPHKSQTAPTQVLYERARLVTTNKASPSSRKPNPPSHRRPWTNEEENALMTGLDQVKGPHWSQILAMYGPGGTINESLKDRNQVQLKDKARNLKLFFLKAGIEVPYYLQAVTGDLKTRAPGQAEKREARERERINAEGGDAAILQDDLQAEFGEDVDLPPESLSDQEDIPDSIPLSHQPSQEQRKNNETPTTNVQGDAFDVEAMIAQAAASATQSLSDSWT